MNTRNRLNESPIGERKDNNDANIARWGRSRHEGFRKFKHNFLQPAPLLFTQDHHPLWLGDIYRGRSAFLISGGPSFASLDHSRLRQPGILTMGINNSIKTFRANLWVCVDSPDHFIRSIWMDPTIMKFVPICHASKFIFNSDEWKFMDVRVGDCPNIVYYKRNEHFKAKQFLWEDCINWGNHKDHGGGRSVMLAAIRILFTLGIRRIYLLGADFKMDENNKYHFAQDRKKNSISGNRETYIKLNKWFAELRPFFEAQDLLIFNCNLKSKLDAFDFISFEDALSGVLTEFGDIDIKNERTQDLYDTKFEEKKSGKNK
jgi:hypothetical protein